MSINENPGCLGALLQMLGIAPRSQEDTAAEVFPYRVRDDFLSPAERAFYGVLFMAVGQRAVVCPKVRLSDVFFVTHPRKHRSAFNRIAQKHVDFLVCEPTTMTPLLGVELDDSSHNRADRQARDAFVGKAFEAAGLPLLRVPVQRGYSVPELAAQLDSVLKAKAPFAGSGATQVANPLPVPAAGVKVEAPLCPKCRVAMVVRTAKQGGRPGQPFYGCPNYPRCRQTVAVNEATG